MVIPPQEMPFSKEIEGKWHQVRLKSFQIATKALEAANTTVIIDDTNEYPSMRKPYFRLAQSKQYKYIEIFFKHFTYHHSLLRD